MTKAELIEAMKDFPDDMEIRIGADDSNCGAFLIDRLEVVRNGLLIR